MGAITYRDIVSNEDELKLLSVVDKLKDSSCVEKVYFTYDTDDHEENPYTVDAGEELVIVVRDDTPQSVMNELNKSIQYDVDYEFVIINMKSYKVRRNKPGIEVLFDRNEPIRLEDWQIPGFLDLLDWMNYFKANPGKLGYNPEFEDETKETNDELKKREKNSASEKPGQVSFEDLIKDARDLYNSCIPNHKVTITVPEGWDKNPEAFVDKPQSTITDDKPTAPIMVIDKPVSYVNGIDQDGSKTTLPYNIGPTQGVLNDTDITLEDIMACGIAAPAEEELYNAIFGNAPYQEECGNSRCRNKSDEYDDLQ